MADDLDPETFSIPLGRGSAPASTTSTGDTDPERASIPVSRKPVMTTSWRSLADGTEWTDQPPSPASVSINEAAHDAFVNAPSKGTDPGNMSVLTRPAQQATNDTFGWLGRNVINPAATGIGYGIGGVSALGAGVAEGAHQLLKYAGAPGPLQRDLAMLQQVVPEAARPFTPVLASRPRLEAPGPTYAGGVTGDALLDAAKRQRERGLLNLPEDLPAVSPTGIGGPRVNPVQPLANTPDLAGAVAKAHYDAFNQAAEAAGAQKPSFTNKFLDNLQSVGPEPGIETAARGPTALSAFQDRLEPFRDQPMTLKNAHAIDKTMTQLITDEYGPTGISDTGRQMQEAQRNFRDQITNPDPGDIVGGQDGLTGLADARKAWSQARKMDDFTRMQERALRTQDPTSSFQTQVRNFVTNEKKVRGWSDEEVAAVEAAANRGFVGNAMRAAGSRLMPPAVAAASVGALGPVGAFATAPLTDAAGGLARSVQTALARQRYAKALDVLAKGVPAPPPPPNPFNIPP